MSTIPGPQPALAVVACLAALVLPAAASADRDYTVRFTQNAQGDITGTGNTLMTCQDSDSRCDNARAGHGSGSDINNNGLAMRYVDVDENTGTFDSSAATLSLPAGARVRFAGLYYGGRLQAGSDGQDAPDPARRNQVLFRPPNLGAYVTVTAAQVDDAPSTGSQTNRLYQGFADVTDLVAAAGPGEYTVANVQLGTGQNADQSGGWALAVAYEDATQPTRNLTIFDGFKFVLADGPPVDIPLSGFITPKSGTVSTRVGLVALEGDLGTTGDSATLNAGTSTARKLTNATNPADNFFNASISSRTAQSFTAKRPNYLNQLGFDADVFDASGFLANNQTSTTLRLATSGDGFAPDAVSFATDLFAPSLDVAKTVDKTDALLGDELTYTVAVTNTGLDAATDTILRDVIPDGTTYMPGSMQVVSGANSGPKTDAPGDDQADFDAAGHAVVIRLGTGATEAAGGRLPINGTTSISFKVKINASLPLGSTIVNDASVGYKGETLGYPGSVTSPDVVTKVHVPDLAIDKSHTGRFVSGASVPFALTVSSVGDAPTTGTVTVTDTLPDELSFVGQPAGAGWQCSTAGRALTCARSDAIAPGSAYPPIRFVARVAPDTPAGELVNTATVSNDSDGNPLNDSDTDVGENAPPRVDLAIDKVALTPFSFPGQPVRFLIRVINHGPNTATDVIVRDLLPRGLTPVSADPSRGSCRGISCHLGTMRRGARASIDLVAVAGPDTGGRVLRDVAAVSAHEKDVDTSNNVDSALVRIIPLVDIVVTKTAITPTVTVGSNAVFLVVVRNDGPSDATGVVFADRLPPQLTGVSARPTQGSCPTPTLCNLGAIAAGGAAQVVLVARPDPSAIGVPLLDVAGAAPRQPDSKLSNNRDSATVIQVQAPPPPPANVRVTKVAETQAVNVGDNLTYRITATNHGPGTADSVLITDTLDAGTTLVSAVPSQGTCSASAPVSCDVGSLAPGASATVDVTVRVDAAGPLRNAVTAVTPTPVPTPGQIAVEASRASSAPIVTLRKRASPNVVRGGESVTFTLTATAHGRGTARNITVCDRLPTGFAMRDPGAARKRDDRWCWQIDALAGGQSRTLTMVTTAPAVGSTTRVTNTAVLAVGDQAPLFAIAHVRILAASPSFTG